MFPDSLVEEFKSYGLLFSKMVAKYLPGFMFLQWDTEHSSHQRSSAFTPLESRWVCDYAGSDIVYFQSQFTRGDAAFAWSFFFFFSFTHSWKPATMLCKSHMEGSYVCVCEPPDSPAEITVNSECQLPDVGVRKPSRWPQPKSLYDHNCKRDPG